MINDIEQKWMRELANLSAIFMQKSLNFRLVNVAKLIEHLPISRHDSRSKEIPWILTETTPEQYKTESKTYMTTITSHHTSSYILMA